MRSIWNCSVSAAVALWACGDPDMSGDRMPPPNSVKLPAGGAASASAGGAGGSTDFGNSSRMMAMQVTGGRGGMGGGGAGGAGGEPERCEDGQFCESNNPDGNCGTIRFKPDVEVTRTPGNLVIVFDQSGSMEDNWGDTGKTKMGAAQEALVAAIGAIKEEVNVAAVFLPTATCFQPGYDKALFDSLGLPGPPAFSGNAVPAISDPTQINFMMGAEFLTAWEAHWTTFMSRQLLGTPLQEGLDRAEEAIAAARMGNLLVGSGQVAVVAFTDGEPNCLPDPMVTMRPTMEMPARAAAWLEQGIKTYVVGLPGADMGAATLNGIAMSGGTMQYIDPADPAALEAKLREVIAETVKTGFNSCSISIDPVPAVPEKLLMIVDEPTNGRQQVPRDLGWSLDTAGKIEITGPLCDDAMSGRFNSITFEYACPEVPPPPVLPPPE